MLGPELSSTARALQKGRLYKWAVQRNLFVFVPNYPKQISKHCEHEPKNKRSSRYFQWTCALCFCTSHNHTVDLISPDLRRSPCQESRSLIAASLYTPPASLSSALRDCPGVWESVLTAIAACRCRAGSPVGLWSRYLGKSAVTWRHHNWPPCFTPYPFCALGKIMPRERISSWKKHGCKVGFARKEVLKRIAVKKLLSSKGSSWEEFMLWNLSYTTASLLPDLEKLFEHRQNMEFPLMAPFWPRARHSPSKQEIGWRFTPNRYRQTCSQLLWIS